MGHIYDQIEFKPLIRSNNLNFSKAFQPLFLFSLVIAGRALLIYARDFIF